MNINRYIIRLPTPDHLNSIKLGQLIFSDEEDIDDSQLKGFVGNVFTKTKSIEVCLFESITLEELKEQKCDILYYEEDYDVQSRFKEIGPFISSLAEKAD